MSIQKTTTIAFFQALVAMGGSLYFSNFGDPLKGLFHGNGFEPCHLCRRTRILMYPLVGILGYGLIRKDPYICYLTSIISLIGIILSGYHYTIQYINSLNVFTCNPTNPCTIIDWQVLGFITIPLLACIAFSVIFICSIVVTKSIHKKI